MTAAVRLAGWLAGYLVVIVALLLLAGLGWRLLNGHFPRTLTEWFGLLLIGGIFFVAGELFAERS